MKDGVGDGDGWRCGCGWMVVLFFIAENGLEPCGRTVFPKCLEDGCGEGVDCIFQQEKGEFSHLYRVDVGILFAVGAAYEQYEINDTANVFEYFLYGLLHRL